MVLAARRKRKWKNPQDYRVRAPDGRERVTRNSSPEGALASVWIWIFRYSPAEVAEVLKSGRLHDYVTVENSYEKTLCIERRRLFEGLEEPARESYQLKLF